MATFRVCCNSSERRSVPGTSGCAVAASASVLRGRGSRISSDRDLCHAHGSWSGSGVGNRESHRRKSRMVEISLSGSGEGPGRVTSRPTLQALFTPPRRSRPPPRGGAQSGQAPPQPSTIAVCAHRQYGNSYARRVSWAAVLPRGCHHMGPEVERTPTAVQPPECLQKETAVAVVCCRAEVCGLRCRASSGPATFAGKYGAEPASP
jgi:hypothetical protein